MKFKIFNKKIDLYELKTFFSYIKQYKYVYWGTLFSAVILRCVINLLMAYVNKETFNSVIEKNITQFKNVIFYAVVLIVISYIYPFTRYFHIKVVRNLMQDIKLGLFKHLVKLPVDYFEEHHSGDSIQRLSVEADSLKTAYFTTVFSAVSSIVGGIIYLASIIIYDYRLAIAGVCISIFSMKITMLVTKYIRKDSNIIQKEMSKLTQLFTDILAGFIEIKMFKGAVVIVNEYIKQNGVLTKYRIKRLKKQSALEGVNFGLSVISNIGIIILGLVFVIKGYNDYGTVMAVITLQFNLNEVFFGFGRTMSKLQISMANAARIFEVFSEPVEKEMSSCKMTKNANGYIKFENVFFDYKTKKNILKDISFNIHKGQKAAIIGPSGGGKSTILKILMGLYKTSEGSIIINNKLINEYSLKELRDNIAYIPQDSYLFEGTIRENIGYGKIDSTDEEIIQAAKKAYAHDFIMTMPGGYDTVLISNGSNLSGGQRQRIAIARAFLKDAPILLLDEATSGIDVESEAIIKKSLDKLMINKTVLIVAHRLTTVKNCDVFLNIDNGTLVLKN